METHKERVHKIAFNFGRQLADSEFRQYLRDNGKQMDPTGDQKIIISYAGEAPEDLVQRMTSDTFGWSENFLLCIEDPDAPFGFRVSKQQIPWRRWASEFILRSISRSREDGSDGAR